MGPDIIKKIADFTLCYVRFKPSYWLLIFVN